LFNVYLLGGGEGRGEMGEENGREGECGRERGIWRGGKWGCTKKYSLNRFIWLEVNY